MLQDMLPNALGPFRVTNPFRAIQAGILSWVLKLKKRPDADGGYP